MSKQSKIFISILSLFLIMFIWGFLIEPGLLFKREIHFDKWAGPPLKVAFIADLHAGAPHINEKYIEDLINRINSMSPNLILIGGDFVTSGVVGGKPMPIEKIVSLLRKLKAPMGIFAVLGNHDWWRGGAEVTKELEQSGIRVLENDAILVHTESNFKFWLVGIGDQFTNHAWPDLAFKKVTTEDPRILIMHDPAALFKVKEKFLLALAGHMHGGQVFIPGIGALVIPGSAPKAWASGWVDFEFGSVFVSKGIGTSILPVRFNAPPEFVILDLKK